LTVRRCGPVCLDMRASQVPCRAETSAWARLDPRDRVAIRGLQLGGSARATSSPVGQKAFDRAGAPVDSIGSQVAQTLASLEPVARASLGAAVRINVYLIGLAHFGRGIGHIERYCRSRGRRARQSSLISSVSTWRQTRYYG
jgi:hypothetical protein